MSVIAGLLYFSALRSSRNTTYEECHRFAGIEPRGWLVTITLNNSGEAARSVSSVCFGSGGNGWASARCRRIEKIF